MPDNPLLRMKEVPDAIVCEGCDAVYRRVELRRREVSHCPRCGTELDRHPGDQSARVLPLTVACLILFAIANLLIGGFAIGSLAVQTVVGAFASYLAWMWMLGRYPATKISVFVFLTPIFALIFGALWLKEPVTPSLLAALALVAAGIVLVNRKPG